MLARMEHNIRRAPAVAHPILNRLTAEANPQELGAKALAEVLCIGLRISKDDALRRLADARELGPRTSFTGEVLEPVLARTAGAQARGQLGAAHIKIIRDFFRHLPAWVDYQTRELAEKDLVQHGGGLKPEELRKVAEQLIAMLHPDGDYTDAERARRRYFTIGRQQPDGTSEVRGRIDPETRASLDAVFAKTAAPGVNNPDEGPDTRTQGQRNHDALKALAQSALASGELGLHNGLPATIIVTTTLQDLESAAGHAVTGGGTRLPMKDVIRLAANAHHYLCIYDKHTREPLYLGRTKRLASKAQRIALYGLDRGCTRPGCPAPPYHTQVHHIHGWAAKNGPSRHQPAHPGLRTRQPAGRTRLDGTQTQRRPHRMDPTPTPGHRPSQSEQLPPPREIPRRRGRRRPLARYAFRLSIQAGIQCVTDLRLTP